MYSVNQAFAFSFGGRNDFSSILKGENFKILINFPEESEVGYGLAIRIAIDIPDEEYKRLEFEIVNEGKVVPINFKVEVKNYRFEIIQAEDFKLTEKSAEIQTQLSPLTKEIVIFVPKYLNRDLNTSLVIKKIRLF